MCLVFHSKVFTSDQECSTMKVLKRIIFVMLIVLRVHGVKFSRSNRLIVAHPCPHNKDVESVYQKGALGQGYNLTIKNIERATDIRLKLDSQANVHFDTKARFLSEHDYLYNIVNIFLINSTDSFTFIIKGDQAPFFPPYMTSLRINGDEICNNANLTYFDKEGLGVLDAGSRNCGRRKVLHTELILSGVPTKPGDWPWHAAIYKRDGPTLIYICGGTLVSEYFVLTAAHCATKNGAPLLPEVLGVVLGKYQLYGNVNTQEKEVHRIYVHDEFNRRNLNNDIALLKFDSEAIYNNYVQPACLWTDSIKDRLPVDAIGTVVGWGFDVTEALSPMLQAAKMPIVAELDCIYSKPEFYGVILKNKRKFCAGFGNGTSPCNGDSGGAFMNFVPDLAAANSPSVPGAWYVRGIISVTLSRPDALTLCDRNAYAVFTDVSKYLNWIKNIIS